MLQRITLYIAIISLYGCANSASHEVVKATSVNDDLLSCKEIDKEIRKVNAIIEGVEQDKKDMTDSDWVDGLLWFPFNVLAKQSNYSSASKAAQARIDNLAVLRHDKNCNDDTEENLAKNLREKSKELNELLKEGIITEDEYKMRKSLLLEHMTPSNESTQTQEPEITASESSYVRSTVKKSVVHTEKEMVQPSSVREHSFTPTPIKKNENSFKPTKEYQKSD